MAWVISREAAAPPSVQSPPLSCRMIKVVSNGRGPSLTAEVILVAIKCIAHALLSCLLRCLLLLSARAPTTVCPGDGSCEAPPWRVLRLTDRRHSCLLFENKCK